MLEYVLATWRLSYLLVREDGPGNLARKLRERTGIVYDEETGHVVSYPDWNPLTCVYCTSIWVAMILFYAPRYVHKILTASAVSVMLEKQHGDR